MGRRIGGRKAQAFGKLFEEIFASQSRFKGIAITRIPDSCRQVSSQRFIRIKSPYDWVCSYLSKTILVDTKTIDGKSFPYSMIDSEQVRELLAHERVGVLAGYVIWLRKIDAVMFVAASTLYSTENQIGSITLDHRGVVILGPSFEMNLQKLFVSVPVPQNQILATGLC